MLQRLGNYEILGELGKGGMGIVYKARDPRLERSVVIKTMSPALADDEALKRRFYREARAAAMLRHPNIVSIYELSEEQGILYIVMEFLPGQTLHGAIQDRLEMLLPRKLEIITDVAHALAFAHRNGVVHRDVKPANIMLLSDGRVKVVDFGIALSISARSTLDREKVGTLPYMSPEQFEEGEIDARSDIFSLGVVLYELLTYRHPFAASNTNLVIRKILQEEPIPVRTLVPQCPPSLGSIVERALKKRRDDRYQAMEDLLRDLGAVYSEAATEVATALLGEAQRLISEQKWISAKTCLEQVVDLDPSRKTARQLLEQVSVELARQSLDLRKGPDSEPQGGTVRIDRKPRSEETTRALQGIPMKGEAPRIAGPQAAPTAFISGRVTNDRGQPLTNIVVRMTNSAGVVLERVETGRDGLYRFENLSPGEYQVACQPPPGFGPKRVVQFVLESGQHGEGNFVLRELN